VDQEEIDREEEKISRGSMEIDDELEQETNTGASPKKARTGNSGEQRLLT
jgi:hypothetical protein